MLKRIHPIAGVVGFLTILTFWTSTVISELVGTAETIASVKHSILWGFLLLVPALALTGASGFKLGAAWKSPQVNRKKRRMPLIAANGILILVPSGFYLAHLAAAGDFGTRFYVVQAIELIAGATNLTLIGRSILDGMQMKGRLRKS